MHTRESHRFPNKHVKQGQPFYFQSKIDLKYHSSDVESTSGYRLARECCRPSTKQQVKCKQNCLLTKVAAIEMPKSMGDENPVQSKVLFTHDSQ